MGYIRSGIEATNNAGYGVQVGFIGSASSRTCSGDAFLLGDEASLGEVSEGGVLDGSNGRRAALRKERS